MNCTFFLGCVDEADVRTKYKTLAKTLHPDVAGGSHASFVAMKAEFDYIVSDNTVIYYPIGKADTNSMFASFKQQATEPFREYPMTPAETLSPEEINNQRAKAHFDRLRQDDQTFDIVDEILAKASAKALKPLWVYQEIDKLFELNIDHFKYLTWKMGDSVSIASMLFRKYKMSKV